MRDSAILRLLASLIILAAGCRHGNRAGMHGDSLVGLESRLLHESAMTVASLDHIELEEVDSTPPRTLDNPEAKELCELTIEQAVHIAMENSEVIRTLAGGQVFAASGGFSFGAATLAGGLSPTDGLGGAATATGVGSGPASFASSGATSFAAPDSGQQTIYDPAIADTNVERALSVFDTRWETSVFWERQDKPSGQTLQGFFTIPTQRDIAGFTSALTKRFATGGQGRIAWNTDYLFVPPARTRTPGPDGIIGTADDVIALSPAQYTPNLELSLVQPLLRGAGSDVNRAPVVIARLQSDQSLWDFKQAVLGLVRSVQEAYWNLYAAHGALRAVEQVIPEVQKLVRTREAEVETGKSEPYLLGEARTRLAEFRQQRFQAMNAVLDRETTLRNLLGLPPSDGRRLVPIDDPFTAPISIDWEATIEAALDHRPDIVKQRLAVRVRELEKIIADNELQPQLDLQALWRVNGLGRELDEAIGLLTDDQFTDWQLGVSFSMPLGFRQAAADVRRAELRLDKDRAVLKQTVHATSHELATIVRDLNSLYLQYQAAEERLAASEQWVYGTRIRATPELAIGPLAQEQNIYLQALQALTAAARDTTALLAQYNTTLARLEEAKGTLLATSNIQLQEDPCAMVRFREPRHTVPPARPLPAKPEPQSPRLLPPLPDADDQ